MARKISAKSPRCIGSSFASARSRAGPSEARIISRTARMRPGSKNMCSVRQSPMPSAPNSRATRASAGVSAFVRTESVRSLSAQRISSSKALPSAGVTVGDLAVHHLAGRCRRA